MKQQEFGNRDLSGFELYRDRVYELEYVKVKSNLEQKSMSDNSKAQGHSHYHQRDEELRRVKGKQKRRGTRFLLRFISGIIGLRISRAAYP